MELANSRIRVPGLIDGESTRRLAHAIEEHLGSASPPVLILEGAPGRFCAGLDLSQTAGGTLDRGDLLNQVRQFAECLRLLRLSPKPVLCLVNGEVRGGGLGIISTSDVVIATPQASFGMTELLFGLVPALIWPFLLERVPPQRARRLALTGTAIDGEEALNWGLVDALTPMGELEQTRWKWERQLRRPSPSSTASLKRFSFERQPGFSAASIEDAISVTVDHLLRPTTQRRIQRFLSGQTPWTELSDEK